MLLLCGFFFISRGYFLCTAEIVGKRKILFYSILKSNNPLRIDFVLNIFKSTKVDHLSCFHTGARQVFTTKKLFPGKISLTMKTAT